MTKTHPPYASEYRRQRVEPVRSGSWLASSSAPRRRPQRGRLGTVPITIETGLEASPSGTPEGKTYPPGVDPTNRSWVRFNVNRLSTTSRQGAKVINGPPKQGNTNLEWTSVGESIDCAANEFADGSSFFPNYW